MFFSCFRHRYKHTDRRQALLRRNNKQRNLSLDLIETDNNEKLQEREGKRKRMTEVYKRIRFNQKLTDLNSGYKNFGLYCTDFTDCRLKKICMLGLT